MKKLFGSAVLLALVACGGGGGGGGGGLSTNACGTIGLDTKSVRIVNGTACSGLSDSPVVRIVAFNGNGDAIGLCSGTMITSNDAVTAAHCFPSGTRSAAIAYGDPGNVTTVVGTFRAHPGYRASTADAPSFAAFNDVGVVSVGQNLPLPVARILTSSSAEAGDEVAIFGYGTDENGEFDFRDLKSGEMEVDSVSSNHISSIFTGEGSNTCQGDSGGPAFLDKNGAVGIVGVTSTGTVQGCSEGDNSLFTNLQSSSALDFLRSVVPDLATN